MARQDLVAQEWQSVLGRAPTQAELQFLSSAIDRGDIELGDIGAIAKTQPDYQQQLAQQQTADYGAQLAKTDEGVLGQAAAQLQGQFARMGRPGSSSYAGAFARAAADLAAQRQNRMADFYGQRLGNIYQGIQQAGQTPLQNIYQQRAAGQNAARDQQYWRERYNIEQDTYQSLLNQQNRQNRNKFYGQLAGATIGGGAGFLFGGPAGAKYGSQLGAGIGGGFGG